MVRVKHVATKPSKRPKRGAKIVGLEKATPPHTRKSTRNASTAETPPTSTTPDTSSDDEPEVDPRFKSTLYREIYYKTFTRRTICECWHVDFDSLDKIHVAFLRRWFKHQQWDKLLIEQHPIYPDLIRQFYTHFDHANKTEGAIVTWVKGRVIKLDEYSLSRIFKIPRGGVRVVLSCKKWSTVKEFDINKSLNLVLDEEDSSRTKKPEIYELPLPTRLLHLILFRFFNCCNGTLSSLTYLDMLVMYFILAGIKINMPRMMIDYMVTTQRSSKEGIFLPYRMWLTKVFMHFDVDLSDEVVMAGPKQPFNKNTVNNALGYIFDTEANKWVKVGVKRAPERRCDPEVQVLYDGDDDEDVGGIPYASSTDDVMLESIVVQEMLKRMRLDIFTADVMSEIRESAHFILDARNEVAADEADDNIGRGDRVDAGGATTEAESDPDSGNADFDNN